MLRLRGRLDKLERVLVPAKGPLRHARVVISGMTKPADLATSTCTRRLANNVLTEVVHIDGDRSDLSDEQLQRFIESFPIQEGTECCA